MKCPCYIAVLPKDSLLQALKPLYLEVPYAIAMIQNVKLIQVARCCLSFSCVVIFLDRLEQGIQ